MNKKYAIEEAIDGSYIKLFRLKHNLSCKDLSEILNVSYRTIEGWESKNSKISNPAVFLLKILNEYPELLKKYEIEKQEYPLRLYYMKDMEVSTIIDVDRINRKVKFKNYTNNLIFRAFGSKEEVSYEEYEEFLKSRCVPETRDKLKISLDDIGVKFYDPMEIIKKTKGRMAEDNCWIKIE